MRRSTSTRLLAEPGPDPDQIRALLRVAARIPDHGKLTPWRFIVVTGDARRAYGEKLASIALSRNPQMDEASLQAERDRFIRAPCVIAVISRARDHAKIPLWEQHLSAGAVCFALLLAGQAMGFAGCWLTEWPAYDDAARSALGLATAERIAGFIYLGSPGESPRERERPDVDGIVTYYEV
jgi:nitroreductase